MPLPIRLYYFLWNYILGAVKVACVRNPPEARHLFSIRLILLRLLMYKIQTLNTIDALGLNQFPRQLYEVASDMASPDAILVRSTSLHDKELPPSVKVVARAGAGVN